MAMLTRISMINETFVVCIFFRPEFALQPFLPSTVFWLSTQDLGVQVMEARKELVGRVIAELEKGMNLKATTSIVTDARAKQLRQNAILLMEAWVHLLADEYSKRRPGSPDFGMASRASSWV